MSSVCSAPYQLWLENDRWKLAMKMRNVMLNPSAEPVLSVVEGFRINSAKNLALLTTGPEILRLVASA
jgi:hypothetical protein